jgi:hypothetical protein
MDLFQWFTKRIGKRVHLHVLGIAPQTWRVYMAGNEVAVLVQPSRARAMDQLSVFYSGITCFADPADGTEPGDIVGCQWDPKLKRWIPLTLAELRGEPSEALEDPEVPDHLPDDIV